VEESREFGEAEGEAFGREGAEGDMAEFAARAGGLAVEMEMGVRDREDFGGFGEIAYEIEHGAVAGEPGRAEREAEDGAEMVLELAGDGAFNRPVAGIVDARCHFVDEKLPLVFKEFKGQDPGVVQGFKNAVGGVFCRALDGGIEARGGCEGEAEDAAAVVILDEGVDCGFAVERADGKDGEFASERDETFEDQFYGRQLGLGFGDVFGGAKNPLAFTVIAHARSLQNGGKANRF